jgi:hypothetical protein
VSCGPSGDEGPTSYIEIEKTKLNQLIMGKITDTGAVSDPVPARNLVATEEFLQNSREEDEEIIYNYQPHILEADDFPDDENRGNTAGAMNRQDNRQDNGQHINHTRNCPRMLSSDDDCYEDSGAEGDLPMEELDYEEDEDQFDDD